MATLRAEVEGLAGGEQDISSTIPLKYADLLAADLPAI